MRDARIFPVFNAHAAGQVPRPNRNFTSPFDELNRPAIATCSECPIGRAQPISDKNEREKKAPMTQPLDLLRIAQEEQSGDLSRVPWTASTSHAGAARGFTDATIWEGAMAPASVNRLARDHRHVPLNGTIMALDVLGPKTLSSAYR